MTTCQTDRKRATSTIREKNENRIFCLEHHVYRFVYNLQVCNPPLISKPASPSQSLSPETKTAKNNNQLMSGNLCCPDQCEVTDWRTVPGLKSPTDVEIMGFVRGFLVFFKSIVFSLQKVEKLVTPLYSPGDLVGHFHNSYYNLYQITSRLIGYQMVSNNTKQKLNTASYP